MAEITSDIASESSKEGDATYDHVIKYTGLFGGVQGITMLVSVVRNKIVSELLGPSGLALIDIFNKIIKLINQSTNFGISFSAVKHVAELSDTASEDEVRNFICTVRTWSLFTALLGMLVCLALSTNISFWTFENYDYARHFAILSLVVGMMAVQGGELAILKGLKKLKKITLISVFAALATLAIGTPIYFFCGIDGVVPALVSCYAVVLCIHLAYSARVAPWSLSLFSMDVYVKGLPMLKLGIGFIVAGIFGQGAEYMIRTLILRFGELADVGLYNSGYTMAVTYANIVFIAFEADYFPRLAASNRDKERQNRIVNQQIEVSVLLMAPLLIFFVLAMPVIVPLLFSSQFVSAVPMATCATFYMFFKALTLPVAYLALARGDSRMYMATELVYDIFIAFAIPLAFRHGGLQAAGWALSAGGLLDFLLIHIMYRMRYSYRFDFSKARQYVLQLICFTVAVFASLAPGVWVKSITLVALLCSGMMSLRILRRETTVLSKLREKLWRR